MILTLIVVIVVYGIGFMLGQKYERDSMLEGVYGVLSQVNKSNLMVDSVTYYYTKESYDIAVKEIQELGTEFVEENDDE